jgi:hypothetical protein
MVAASASVHTSKNGTDAPRHVPNNPLPATSPVPTLDAPDSHNPVAAFEAPAVNVPDPVNKAVTVTRATMAAVRFPVPVNSAVTDIPPPVVVVAAVNEPDPVNGAETVNVLLMVMTVVYDSAVVEPVPPPNVPATWFPGTGGGLVVGVPTSPVTVAKFPNVFAELMVMVPIPLVIRICWNDVNDVYGCGKPNRLPLISQSFPDVG